MSDRLLLDVSTEIPDVVWTAHRVNSDERGSLTEAFRVSESREIRGFHIAQVNVSVNAARTLRGMHWHEAQFDYWYIADGFMQVAVAEKGQWESRILSPGHGAIIPPGISHGFLALTPSTLIYGVSQEFDEEQPDEQGWHPYSGYVEWALPYESVTLSGRDERADSYMPKWVKRSYER